MEMLAAYFFTTGAGGGLNLHGIMPSKLNMVAYLLKVINYRKEELVVVDNNVHVHSREQVRIAE